MEWILNALANAFLEALNDILFETTDLITGFNLEVWDASSEFGMRFDLSGFLTSVQVLAMFLVIMGAILKLYQSMGGPFTQSEEPGVIVIRTIFAGAGVIFSYRIYAMVVKAFNGIYGAFVAVYTGMAEEYNSGSWRPSEAEREATRQAREQARQSLQGSQYSVNQYDLSAAGNSAGNNTGMGDVGAFNFLGGDSFIRGIKDPSLGLIIIEVVIGCALIICLFKLVLETYERYVLLGIMYFTAPLAFATLVSKSSQVFKNWCQMLICQIILMCFNLLFLGGFVGAWYEILDAANKNHYVFTSVPEYLTTMFIMIGWLIAGQKMDEHLRSVGLSASQTGTGLMGAMMGGAGVAMAAFRAVGGIARSAGRNVHNAATGQTKIQKAVQMGSEGRGGGIYGEVLGQNSINKAAKAEQIAKAEERAVRAEQRAEKSEARSDRREAREQAREQQAEARAAEQAAAIAAAERLQTSLQTPMNHVPEANNYSEGANLSENAAAAAADAGMGKMDGLGETYMIGDAEFQTMRSADGSSQIDIAKNDAAAEMIRDEYGNFNEMNGAKPLVSLSDSNGESHLAVRASTGGGIKDRIEARDRAEQKSKVAPSAGRKQPQKLRGKGNQPIDPSKKKKK